MITKSTHFSGILYIVKRQSSLKILFICNIKDEINFLLTMQMCILFLKKKELPLPSSFSSLPSSTTASNSFPSSPWADSSSSYSQDIDEISSSCHRSIGPCLFVASHATLRVLKPSFL